MSLCYQIQNYMTFFIINATSHRRVCSPFSLNRNIHRVGIIVSAREGILCKRILMKNCSIKGFFIDWTWEKRNALYVVSTTPIALISHLLNTVGMNVDLLTWIYEKMFLISDFNSDMQNSDLRDSCELYSLKSVMKFSTCIKSPVNPKCMELILNNSCRSFQNSCGIKTGFPDFHQIIIAVMKTYYRTKKRKTINHRHYRRFSVREYRKKNPV